MSEQLATFFNARIGSSKYLFLLTNNSAFDIDIRKALQHNVPKFGSAVAEKARISTIHDGSERRAFDELLKKSWPERVRARLDVQHSPFLVLINTDFAAFDPQLHDWFIIWLVGLGQPKHAIPGLFDKLGRVIVSNGNLFEFLNSKIEAPGGFFRPGTIWNRDRFDILPEARRRGRTPIVRKELIRMLDKLLLVMRLPNSRWRNSYSIEAQKWLQKHGECYPVKSVYDALRRDKWFAYAERTIRTLSSR